jgi:hypothetical protein
MSQRDLIFAVSILIVGGSLVTFLVALWRRRGDREDRD